MKPRLLLLFMLLLLVAVPALWLHFQPPGPPAIPVGGMPLKSAPMPELASATITIERPKTAPTPAKDVATGADPVLQKQAEAETMRRDTEKTLAEVRQLIDSEAAKHPEQRAALEAQYAQISASLEKEIASVQGSTTDWGAIEFTEGIPVQKTTVDGQIYELVATPGSDGMIYVTFSADAPQAGENQKEPVSRTRSLPGYPMTARIGGGEIKFVPKWKADAPAPSAATGLTR